jgi:hypothetical protein
LLKIAEDNRVGTDAERACGDHFVRFEFGFAVAQKVAI